jgi:hypothetical protein
LYLTAHYVASAAAAAVYAATVTSPNPLGPNICDKFRDIPLQAADFPAVDFSLMHHTTDKVWEAVGAKQAHDGGCYSVGEAETAAEQRALEFYRWIMTRQVLRL